MTIRDAIMGYITRHARAAAFSYVGLISLFCIVILCGLVNLAGQMRGLDGARQTLARLEAHAHATPAQAPLSHASMPSGSPVLVGQTVTLAEAALITRVTGAVSRAGGNVISSEVASRDDRAHKGYLQVIITCEIEQASMQRLIYDIEAGMPLLFIDRLDANISSGPTGSMRLVLGVSGLWQSAK